MNNKNEKIFDLDALNGIRVIAAFLIVVFHYNKLTGGPHTDRNFPFYSVLKIAYVDGGLMVEMFFLISGLCLYKFYSERLLKKKITVIEFLKKRFLKLYPLYITTTIMTIGLQQVYFKVNGVYFENNFDRSWKYLAFNFLGIARGWYENETYPYNAPAWYVSVLLFIYLVFAIICYISSKKEQIKVKLTVLTVLGMSVGTLIRWKEMQYPIFNVEMGRGLQSFFLGGLIYLLIEKISSNRAKRKMLWCVTGIFLTSTICIIIRQENIFEKTSFFSMIFFPYIVVIAISNPFIRKILTLKILRELNGITYEIFLLQYPIFILFKLIGDRIGFNYYSLVIWFLFWAVLLSVCYGFSIWKKRISML